MLRTAFAALLIPAAIKAGISLAIAPPLLVAYTEFSRVRKWDKNPKNEIESVKHPFITVGLITLCAVIGSYTRLLLTETLGLPLTLSAFVAAVLMLILLNRTGRFVPPAGALTILAVLIPSDKLVFYPVQVFTGISVLMLAAEVIIRLHRLLAAKII